MYSEYGPLATLTVCTERTIRQLLLAFGPLRFVRIVRTVRTVTHCALMLNEMHAPYVLRGQRLMDLSTRTLVQ